MGRILKKLLATCLIGFGLGVLIVLLLPLSGWLFIIGSVITIAGLCSLFHK